MANNKQGPKVDVTLAAMTGKRSGLNNMFSSARGVKHSNAGASPRNKPAVTGSMTTAKGQFGRPSGTTRGPRNRLGNVPKL